MGKPWKIKENMVCPIMFSMVPSKLPHNLGAHHNLGPLATASEVLAQLPKGFSVCGAIFVQPGGTCLNAVYTWPGSMGYAATLLRHAPKCLSQRENGGMN